jgi:hypothetical protein
MRMAAKRRYAWDENKFARFRKEGRGEGQGELYKPWLTIQDVPSMGRMTRVQSFKTGRMHHFLSDLETDLFFLLEWDSAVVDIREQFPLDREETRRIAQDMGVVHPRDTHTNVDIVMTSDMVIDIQTPAGICLTVRSVKPSDDLSDRRVIEKLEIERRYWQARSTPWHLVTDRDLPDERVKKIKWLYELYSLEHLVVTQPSYWDDRCQRFVHQLHVAPSGLIRDFFVHLEKTCGFAKGDAMTVLRHLAARRVVLIDLDRPFSTNDSIDHLSLSDAAFKATWRAA